MMRLKDESFFLHVGQPVALEFDRIKETANALYFDKGFVDFRCYGDFWIKCHCWHLYNFPLNALPNINLRCLTPQILFVKREHLPLFNIDRINSAYPVWKRKSRCTNLNYALI